MTNEGIKCVSCMWFRSCKVDDSDENYQWGRCHLNPPQLPPYKSNDFDIESGIWPIVQFTDFCGRFVSNGAIV